MCHYTPPPGRGMIVNNSWAQWRTWRDSDYTVTIVILQNVGVLVLRLSFVLEL